MQQKQAKTDPQSPPTDKYLERINYVLQMIPAEVISQRAIECKSYSRALFYWEQHIREIREAGGDEKSANGLLEKLQDIYTQIDEPDGIEGISAHLHVLDIDQQILGHRKAGRWTAAQSWYEIQLAEDPKNLDVQVNLLTCLKESGQHGEFTNAILGNANENRCSTQLCRRHAYCKGNGFETPSFCYGSLLGYWQMARLGEVHKIGAKGCG